MLKEGSDWLDWPVPEIQHEHIQDCLDELMGDDKGYMANRTYVALHTFFKWCKSRKKIDHNPMLDIEKPFDKEKRRKRPWNYDELKRIWKAAERIGGVQGAYIKLLMIMGQRCLEIAGINDEEITDNIWTLPEDRAKNKRDHKFPLPDLALQIIEGTDRFVNNPHVFPGRGKKGHLVPGTKIKDLVKKYSKVNDFSYHQARDTLRTELDKLGLPDHIKLVCLNHTPQDIGAKNYSSYDYLEEQRQAFCAWADRLEAIVTSKDDNLIEMVS